MKLRYLVAAAALVLAASGCGDSGAPTAASSPTPTSTPSASFDKATVRACAYAKTALAGTDEAADKAAEDALAAAGTSDVTVLRELAEKYAPTGTDLDLVHTQTGATAIGTWCLDHGMG